MSKVWYVQHLNPLKKSLYFGFVVLHFYDTFNFSTSDFVSHLNLTVSFRDG